MDSDLLNEVEFWIKDCWFDLVVIMMYVCYMWVRAYSSISIMYMCIHMECQYLL